MEYICLRDCFVHNRFHYKGKVYDLPLGESPKNFKPTMAIEEALNPPPEEPTQAEVIEPPKAEAKTKKKKKKAR